MEKNMMDGVEPSEEASGIEDLLASAVDNEEVMSPDDALEFESGEVEELMAEFIAE